MEMKIPLVAISAFVVVVVLAAVLMPVLGDATDTDDTFTNEGYFHMTKYDMSTDVTIYWDHTTPTKLTVNGETYDVDTPVNQFVSLAIGDTWYFRYANGVSNFYTQMSYGGVTSLAASTTAGTDLQVVCSAGTATGTVLNNGAVSSTQTVSYTELYVLSGDTGDYVTKKSTDKVYMAADSEFLGLGSTAIGSSGSCICRVEGSIEDDASVTVIAASTGLTLTVKSGSIAITDTALTKNIGYQLSKIDFTLVDGSSNEYNVTYSYFIVPSEVTLEKTEHLTGNEIALLAAIPALVIIALLIGVIAIFARSRMD